MLEVLRFIVVPGLLRRLAWSCNLVNCADTFFMKDLRNELSVEIRDVNYLS
jgi:hypothetical protein